MSRENVMTMDRHFSHIRAAVLVAAAGLFLCLPAAAQFDRDEAGDLRARIERLERDVRDVQREAFRNRGEAFSGSEMDAAPSAAAAPASQRVNDIEASLRTLTGQLEELTHRVNDLAVKVDRLHNEMNYRSGGQAQPGGGQGGGEMGMAMGPGDEADTAPRELAPGPRNLGTLPPAAIRSAPQDSNSQPYDEPLPPPARPRAAAKPGLKTATVGGPAAASRAGGAAAGGGDANSKFNAAMDLLARGSYDQARAAFHAIADQYPNDKLAPEALYWTGDISYSAKKDYADAARSFAELLKKYPKATRAPNGMLKLGQSLVGLGQKQEGCATLAALPAKYPAASKTLLAKAKAERKKAACG